MKSTEIKYKVEKKSKLPETFNKTFVWTEKLPKLPETPSQCMYIAFRLQSTLITISSLSIEFIATLRFLYGSHNESLPLF
jgi:hypothetical protein